MKFDYLVKFPQGKFSPGKMMPVINLGFYTNLFSAYPLNEYGS